MNHDNHLLLDQPFLKVPYEAARKTFKTSQRYIERDREHVLSTLKTAANEAIQSQDAASSANASLDSMILRMETLKRKLSALQEEEKTNHRQTRARISHLQDLHNITTPSTSQAYTTWSKTRLDRLLVDYLLRSGYSTSASALATQTNITDLVDISTFESCLTIEESLKHGKLQEALAWCAENKPALKKLDNSALETELRLQQYVELLRSRTTTKLREATVHARKHLITPSITTGADGENVEGTANLAAAGLLAFKPNLTPYGVLYDRTRYTTLAALFLKTHHALLSLPSSPALHTALSAGLSALKTPSCHSRHAASTGTTASTARSDAGVCPICSTELNELARVVPWANRTNSVVETEPVVLPNGRIYGLERLKRLNEGFGSPRQDTNSRSVSRETTMRRVGEEDMDVDDHDEEEGTEDDDEEEEEGGVTGEGDTNDVMSVEHEEDSVPGGRGSVKDPMPPGEWFEWRDVRKVFIM
jgi:macrophage erythroblast attacher